MKNKTNVSVVLFLLVIAILLSACGESANVNASKLAVTIGKSAIEAVDDYLDLKSSVKETRRTISDLQDQISYVSTEDKELPTHVYDFSISISLTSITAELASVEVFGLTAENYDELLEVRNNLAEKVGVKAREK